jgi:hypothetical protein
MEESATKTEVSAGDDWKNGVAEAASSNSAESVAPSKDVISKNCQSSPTAKTESIAPAHTSPRKRRKVNHGIIKISF